MVDHGSVAAQSQLSRNRLSRFDPGRNVEHIWDSVEMTRVMAHCIHPSKIRSSVGMTRGLNHT